MSFCVLSEYQIQIQVQDPITLELDPMQTQTLTVDPSQIDISQLQNVVVIPSDSTNAHHVVGTIANLISADSVTAASPITATVATTDSSPPASAPSNKRRRRSNNTNSNAQSVSNNVHVEVVTNSNHRYCNNYCFCDFFIYQLLFLGRGAVAVAHSLANQSSANLILCDNNYDVPFISGIPAPSATRLSKTANTSNVT